MSFDFGIIDKHTKLKLAFDLHGVIDVSPKAFERRLIHLKRAGHYTYLISGPPKEQLIKELDNLAINHAFDEIFSIVDYLKAKDVQMNKDKDGQWWTSDAIWWSAKAQICKEYGIDIMFDDTFAYQAWFMAIKTKFVHINNKKHITITDVTEEFVSCYLCHRNIYVKDAHSHDGHYIGDCCWDERLRTTS